MHACYIPLHTPVSIKAISGKGLGHSSLEAVTGPFSPREMVSGPIPLSKTRRALRDRVPLRIGVGGPSGQQHSVGLEEVREKEQKSLSSQLLRRLFQAAGRKGGRKLEAMR